MVELIVVMALVTILVGIALPRIDFERARVRSAANALVTVLSAAQSRAVLNQHDVVIRFDTVAGSALVHLDRIRRGACRAQDQHGGEKHPNPVEH